MYNGRHCEVHETQQKSRLRLYRLNQLAGSQKDTAPIHRKVREFQTGFLSYQMDLRLLGVLFLLVRQLQSDLVGELFGC